MDQTAPRPIAGAATTPGSESYARKPASAGGESPTTRLPTAMNTPPSPAANPDGVGIEMVFTTRLIAGSILSRKSPRVTHTPLASVATQKAGASLFVGFRGILSLISRR